MYNLSESIKQKKLEYHIGEQKTLFLAPLQLVVKDKITLFTYALPYYIGVILRVPTQNNSYILWESMCLFNYPYAMVFSHNI